MRHKNLRTRRNPLNLTDAIGTFGKLKGEHPCCADAARLGQRLVREVQYLHGLLYEVRAMLPETYAGYADPARLDAALGRTCVNDRD